MQIPGRHNCLAVATADGGGEPGRDVARRTKRAVAAEFADADHVAEQMGSEVVGGREDCEGDGEVQAAVRAGLSVRDYTDRDRSVRPGETAVDDGGTDPVADLFCGAV